MTGNHYSSKLRLWFRNTVFLMQLCKLFRLCMKKLPSAITNVLKHLDCGSVYGETSYEQMQMIINQTVFRESDVFLDLGCGVGQLVMYVAGGTKVKKAVGIEINDLPARYGAAMSEDFSK
ncbi:unnamed protein product [Heligmosomoides polygyrus]|uniref:Histone-lysine N-methyltransferase, H3 lysine-79 specific n=1 Tax=Heligmosomoides polygyrus TaxID=6339 RepID=A0A183GSA0_HELPZ|nr:unnamed protein product [Heligmosomoides polygyrus]